ncbi:MAG: DUF952 domain-containing protein [Proteobacteria bacterium]|nr:DUF952 domain-containing protein [Pseudomonadota bacterium]
MTAPLFHLMTRAAWELAQRAGVYRAASLDVEGFIHLSTADQWPRTRQRFYADVPELVLLELDPTRLAAEVRYEPAHGEDFPHLYGALELAAVVRVTILERA